MVNIAYFANQFADECGHGLARYALELFDAIGERKKELNVSPVAAWSSLPDEQLETLKTRSRLRILPSGRRGTAYGWTFFGAPPIEWMMPGQIDVTHAVAMGYPIATRKPLVVTIHDLGPLTHPEYFSGNRPWLMQKALNQAVKQAAVIVCISHATAEEVVELCGDSVRSRLRVVHSGVSNRFFENPEYAHLSGLSSPPHGVPFILSAGKISPRKNVQGLLRALAKVRSEIPHHLVLTGGNGWDMDQVLSVVDELALSDRVHMAGYVSDDALRALYRQASVYVHASLYEGFGLTILEAMASGTPVITSDRSSLPEVAGDAALLVNPHDPESIAAALVTICGNSGVAEKMRQAGIARARAFPWENTAEKMIEIYNEIAGK